MSTENVKPAEEELNPVVLKVAIVLVIGAFVPLFDSTMVNYEISYFYHNSKAQKECYLMKKLSSGRSAVIQLDSLTKTFGEHHAVVFKIHLIGIIHEGKLIQEIKMAHLEQPLRKHLVLDGRNQNAIRHILSEHGYHFKENSNGSLILSERRATEKAMAAIKGGFICPRPCCDVLHNYLRIADF